MLFQTLPFFIFFAVVYSVYLLIKGTRLRLPWLLVSSYVFYAWLSPLYLIPLAYATVVDYFVAGRIEKSPRKRAWLAVSIANNLVVLGFFKYAGFVAENVNLLLSSLRRAVRDSRRRASCCRWACPSFSCNPSATRSTSIAARPSGRRASSRTRRSCRSSRDCWPDPSSGPTTSCRNCTASGRVTPRDFTDGLSIFVVGYFKKVASGRLPGDLRRQGLRRARSSTRSPALLLATFLFAWQIYFDFSGYTDMARGIARMMGIGLMLNFNNPYLAVSMGDFWRRWHISLSSWFRDYVYIPLGGNRGGKLGTYRNLFLTMVLSGLWHGAAWTFVLWGAVHALGNFATRELERTPFYVRRLPTIVKQLFVFALVTFAWIFFRAASIGDAWTIVTRIFTSGLVESQLPAAGDRADRGGVVLSVSLRIPASRDPGDSARADRPDDPVAGVHGPDRPGRGPAVHLYAVLRRRMNPAIRVCDRTCRVGSQPTRFSDPSTFDAWVENPPYELSVVSFTFL